MRKNTIIRQNSDFLPHYKLNEAERHPEIVVYRIKDYAHLKMVVRGLDPHSHFGGWQL